MSIEIRALIVRRVLMKIEGFEEIDDGICMNAAGPRAAHPRTMYSVIVYYPYFAYSARAGTMSRAALPGSAGPATFH